MGDAPDQSLQDRYAAVERLYSRGQWPQVLDACAALLAELPAQPGDPLRTRLLLLQGHTQLHGFGQADAAATHYQQVLNSQPEALLQSIAEQELERCRQQLSAPQQEPTAAPPQPAPTPGLSAPFPWTPQAIGNPDKPQQACAMPWLDALGGVDPAAAVLAASTPAASATPPWLAATAAEPEPQVRTAPVDVIDEPDQIEVHQADPARSEILDLIALTTEADPADGTVANGDGADGGSDTPLRVEPTTLESAAVEATEPRETAALQEARPWSPAEEAELARGLLTVVLG